MALYIKHGDWAIVGSIWPFYQTDCHRTGWPAAGPLYGTIRQYIIHMAIYWTPALREYMTVCGSIWQDMAVYDSTGQYWTVYCSVWQYAAVYNSIWQYMTVYDSTGQYMKVYDRTLNGLLLCWLTCWATILLWTATLGISSPMACLESESFSKHSSS